MKRIIGLFLSAALILQMLFVMSVFASDLSAVFELDISDYNSSQKTGITNAGSSTTAVISIPGGAPALGSRMIMTGETEKHLEFNTSDNKRPGVFVKVEDAALTAGTDLTYEMWVKPDGAGGGADTLLMITDGATESMQIMLSGTTLNAKVFGKQLGGSRIYDTLGVDDWSHLVFTRKFADGEWIGAAYINGKSIGTLKKTGELIENSSYYLTIGGLGAGLTFKGDISGFKAYDRALDSNEVKVLYDEAYITYLDCTEEMNLVSAKPSADTRIPLYGTIELTFDNFVDKDTIDNITFTDSEGKALPGMEITAGEEEYTKKVYVNYSGLENDKEYWINIDTGLASTLGYYHELANIKFTSESNVLFEEDFSGEEYEVGTPPPMDKGIVYISDNVTGSNSNFVVLETEDGDKYIAGVSNTVKTDTMMIYDIEPDLKKEAVEIELGVKGYVPNNPYDAGSGPARKCLRFYNIAGKYTAEFGDISQKLSFGGGVASSTPADDGFSYIKVVVAPGDDGLYSFDLYTDTDSDEYRRFGSANNLTYADIGKVMLAHVYPTEESHCGSCGFAITSVKVSRVNVPILMGETNRVVEKGTDSLDLQFSCAMDENSLENAEYVLSDETGEYTVNVEYSSYDEENNTITLELMEHLLPEINYSLSVIGAVSEENRMFVGNDVLTLIQKPNANVPTNTSIGALSAGATRVDASIDVPSGEKVSCALMLFDAAGRLKASKLEEVSSVTGGIALSLEKHTVESGDTAKLIIMDKTDSGGYFPVFALPITMKCE